MQWAFVVQHPSSSTTGLHTMSNAKHGNKEAKKPKKEVPKVLATSNANAPAGAAKKK